MEFEPDNTMFKHYHFIPEYLDDLMWNYAFLNAGLTINYNGKKFFSKDGLLDLLKQKIRRRRAALSDHPFQRRRYRSRADPW